MHAPPQFGNVPSYSARTVWLRHGQGGEEDALPSYYNKDTWLSTVQRAPRTLWKGEKIRQVGWQEDGYWMVMEACTCLIIRVRNKEAGSNLS